MNDDNKSIKCNVESCKYNNTNDNYCTLNDSCDACKKETICDSFKERK